MAYFPIEVVTDILSRLPAKPLLRFRCVSKPWCSLIDSPDFIKLQLNRSIKTRTNQTLLLIHALVYSLNLDSPDAVAVEIDHPFKDSFKLSPKIWGSCDGLVLLNYEVLPKAEPPLNYDLYEEEDLSTYHVTHLDDTLVIWNPSTREHHKLPITKVEDLFYNIETEPEECYIHFAVYGIGYDSVHDDYKVLRVLQFRGRYEDQKIPSEAKVYSLKSNQWRRLKTFPYYICNEGCHGVMSNGALHYIVSENDRFDFYRFVAAFDLATDEYRLVPMPNVADKTCHMNVAVLEECLCVLCSNWGHSMDIWVMKEYGVKESWIKLISVPQPGGIDAFKFMKPFAFSKDGTKVLLAQDFDSLVWYDLESKVGNIVNVRGLPEKYQSEFVMQSLVPIGSGNKSYGKKQQREEDKETSLKKTGKKRDGFLSHGFKLKL